MTPNTPSGLTRYVIRGGGEFLASEKGGFVMHSDVASLEEENKRLRELLDDLYDDSPCSFDHHGYCQEHGWLQPGTCIMARVRAALSGDKTDGE
jgi:hypothetical protein